MATQTQKNVSFPTVVNLNVGGQMYTTSLSTLTKYPESMLGAMFSGRFAAQQDSNGNYFIDRDGALFRYVLEFLCNGELQALENHRELRLLLKEAEFFRIPAFEEAVKQQMESQVGQKSNTPEETEMLTIVVRGNDAVISVSGRVITLRELFHVSDVPNEQFQIVPYSTQSDRPDSSKTGKLTVRSEKRVYADEIGDTARLYGFVTSTRRDNHWILTRTIPKH